MHAGAFAADRDTGSQGHRQQQDLPEGDPQREHEATLRNVADPNRGDRLRNARAFGAGKEPPLQPDDERHGDHHRDRRDDRPPRPLDRDPEECSLAAGGGVEMIADEFQSLEQHRDQADRDRQHAGDGQHAQQDRERGTLGWLVGFGIREVDRHLRG
jgi:hypothetical protein